MNNSVSTTDTSTISGNKTLHVVTENTTNPPTEVAYTLTDSQGRKLCYV